MWKLDPARLFDQLNKVPLWLAVKIRHPKKMSGPKESFRTIYGAGGWGDLMCTMYVPAGLHFVGAKFCQDLVSRYKIPFCRSHLCRVCWQHEGLNKISQIPGHLAQDCLGSMATLAESAVSPWCLACRYGHLLKMGMARDAMGATAWVCWACVMDATMKVITWPHRLAATHYWNPIFK